MEDKEIALHVVARQHNRIGQQVLRLFNGLPWPKLNNVKIG